MVTAFDPACVATGGQEAVDVGAFTENSREIVGSVHKLPWLNCRFSCRVSLETLGQCCIDADLLS